MKNLTPYCYQRRVYDEVEPHRTLERINKAWFNSSPIDAIIDSNGVDSVIYAVYEDDSTERLSAQDLIDLGLIKENIFDDSYLEEYARVKLEQEKPQIWGFGVHPVEHNGKTIMATGSMPIRYMTAEEIIKEYKRVNRYSWV